MKNNPMPQELLEEDDFLLGKTPNGLPFTWEDEE
jgi:hypothetical protein